MVLPFCDWPLVLRTFCSLSLMSTSPPGSYSQAATTSQQKVPPPCPSSPFICFKQTTKQSVLLYCKHVTCAISLALMNYESTPPLALSYTASESARGRGQGTQVDFGWVGAAQTFKCRPSLRKGFQSKCNTPFYC